MTATFQLLPPLSTEDYARLRAEIARQGVLVPVEVDEDGEILDGHNRRAIADELGIECPTVIRYGLAYHEKRLHAVSLNLARRHLTDGQKTILGRTIAPDIEEAARRRQGERTDLTCATDDAQVRKDESDEDIDDDDDEPDIDAVVEQHKQPSFIQPVPPRVERSEIKRRPPPPPPPPPPKRRSVDEVAKKVGLGSGRSFERKSLIIGRIEEKAPDLYKKIEAGEIEPERADRIIRDREAQDRRIAQAKAEAEAQPKPTTVDIRHGDFRVVLADLTGIDAIITDPPYPKEYLPLIGDLGAWADKVLAPDGVLAILIGQTHLPEVYRLLDGHRPYRWTMAYLTPGNGYVSHPRRVQSNWKPLILYGGGPRVADTLSTEGTDANAKTMHKWGQDYGAFHTLVERLTKPGQTIVDPFMGSGTTLLAGRALGRNVIGADLEEESVTTARGRLR